MLFTATSRGFPAIDGFLVFPALKRLKPNIALNGKPITELQSVTCRMGSHSVRVSVRVRVREALSYGGHESFHKSR